MHVLLHSVPPTLQQTTTNPCLHQRLPDTHRHVWDSLFCGHCSFLLGPRVHKVLLCPPRVYFPVQYKFWQLYGGLMATSSKSAYAIPKSVAPRAPVPVADHCQPVSPQGTLKHSSVSVSVGSLGPGIHKVCLSTLHISGRNTNSPFLPFCWNFSFALGCGISPPSHSCAYRLTGVSLTLDVGYLHMAGPAKHSCHS